MMIDRAKLRRAVARCRGEGWTVRKVAEGRWRVAQCDDVRELDFAGLLDFAGIEP